MSGHARVIMAYWHATHNEWEMYGWYDVPAGSKLPDGSTIKGGVVAIKEDFLNRDQRKAFFDKKENTVGWEFKRGYMTGMNYLLNPDQHEDECKDDEG